MQEGHEARPMCANNHISERTGRVTDLLSNQGDFWSGFCGQNSQCPLLSQNPQSVKHVTLSRVSQITLGNSAGRAGVNEHDPNVLQDLQRMQNLFGIFTQVLGWNPRLVPTPFLCPHWSYFTLSFGTVICSRFRRNHIKTGATRQEKSETVFFAFLK